MVLSFQDRNAVVNFNLKYDSEIRISSATCDYFVSSLRSPHSLAFHTCFSSPESDGGSSKILYGSQQPLKVLLASHQDKTKSGRDVIKPPGR